MTYKFSKINAEKIPWDILQTCYDHTVCKSEGWARYLEKAYNVSPFIVEIQQTKNNQVIGYFYGQQITKIGVRIVASPFEGWSTNYQGLSLLHEISIHKRIDIYESLAKWLFENKYCIFLQISDWQLEVPECLHRELNIELIKGYMIDLSISEEELWKNLDYSSAKYSINKAIKNGITIKKPEDINQFIKNHYAQLLSVFEEQGLTPTHSISQLQTLLKHNYPQNILALEAYDKNEKSIASAIYPYNGNWGFFLSAASFSKNRNQNPNELLMWEAIKELKRRGVIQVELGGGRRYKEKYGPKSIVKTKIIFTKYKWLIIAKKLAKNTFGLCQFLSSKVRGKKIKSPQNR